MTKIIPLGKIKYIGKLLRVTGLWIILTPITIIIAGAGSNQMVLIANHEKFPVMLNDYKRSIAGPRGEDQMIDPVHCVMTSKTHLNFLGDLIEMVDGDHQSIGDLLLTFGYWLWAFAPYVWGFEVIRRLIKNEIHI